MKRRGTPRLPLPSKVQRFKVYCCTCANGSLGYKEESLLQFRLNMSSVKTENSNLLQLPPLTPQKKQSREHTRVEKTSTPIKYAEAARESISGQLKHWKKSKQKEARLRRQLLLADELQRLLAESGEEEVEFFKTKTFAGN